MPPTTSEPAPKRRPPTFKPPRPAKSTKQTPAARRKSAPTKSKRPSFLADEAAASEEDDEADEDDDEDENPLDVPSSSDPSGPSDPAPLPTSTQDPPQTIPPALLSRLLRHHFKVEGTRIGKEAEGVVGKYMETFVREAIARAAFERAESEEGGGGAGGWSGGFLEVSRVKGRGMEGEVWREA